MLTIGLIEKACLGTPDTGNDYGEGSAHMRAQLLLNGKGPFLQEHFGPKSNGVAFALQFTCEASQVNLITSEVVPSIVPAFQPMVEILLLPLSWDLPWLGWDLASKERRKTKNSSGGGHESDERRVHRWPRCVMILMSLDLLLFLFCISVPIENHRLRE